MANNAKIALLLAALALLAHGRGGGGGGFDSRSTSAIAEQVHRDRAARQAAVYRDVADRIESGALADPPAAGAEVVRRIAEIEADVAKPLAEDAGDRLPDDQWDDRPAAAAWFRAAADGFEKVAK